jgi:putative SOS response-associated peptidase YedK
MCGRFGFFELKYFIDQLRQLELPFVESPDFRYAAGYNIAPESSVVALLGNHGRCTLTLAHWGMIPHWAKDRPKVRPINARAETLASKPYFRHMLNRQHCLIPASGFYEWKRTQGTGKQPYYIHLKDGSPMAFAGLWDTWRPPEPQAPPITSCTIITTDANREMKPIHDRMPVILEQEHWKLWLEAGSPEAVRLLVPPVDDRLEIYPVSTRVNNPQYIRSDCIDQIEDDLLDNLQHPS